MEFVTKYRKMDGNCDLDLEFEYWVLFGLAELNLLYPFSPFAINRCQISWFSFLFRKNFNALKVFGLHVFVLFSELTIYTVHLLESELILVF